jgi:hypothetical protein
LTPYKAALPTITADNFMGGKPKDKAMAEWMKKTQQQDFAHADMADPQTLNAIIWFACTGNSSNMPQAAALPAYQAMRLGISETEEAHATTRKKDNDD